MDFLRLFRRYILRDLFKNKARGALTVSGIALGISVVVAVHLANERAIGSFNDSLEIMAGRADLEITANGFPLPDDSLRIKKEFNEFLACYGLGQFGWFVA